MQKKRKTKLEVQWVSIEQLQTDQTNAREHDEQNIQAIRASLRQFGFQKPIVCNKKMMVKAGSGTLQAAIEEGYSEVPVVVSSLSAQKLKAFAIADNRTAELANWDFQELDLQLSQLETDGFDLCDLGFFEDVIISEHQEEEAGIDDHSDIKYRILIECQNEQEQKKLLQQFQKKKLNCKAVIS